MSAIEGRRLWLGNTPFACPAWPSDDLSARDFDPLCCDPAVVFGQQAGNPRRPWTLPGGRLVAQLPG